MHGRLTVNIFKAASQVAVQEQCGSSGNKSKPIAIASSLVLPSSFSHPASCDMTRHGLSRAAPCLHSSCLRLGPQLSKHLQASKCPLTALKVETQHRLSNKHALNNPGPTPAFTIEINHSTPTRVVNQATGDKVAIESSLVLSCVPETSLSFGSCPFQTTQSHRDPLLLRQMCFAICFRY